MIEGIYSNGLIKKDEIQFVRNQCLVDQGLLGDFNFDLDDEAVHVIVYENNNPIAVGRFISQNKKEYLDHIYVLNQKRRQGFGDLVVKMLLDKAFRLGAERVFVQTPQYICGFFESIGFEKVEEQNNCVSMVIQSGMIRKCKN